MSRHSISTVPTANENPQKHSSKDLSEKNTKKIHRRTFPDLVTALKGVLNLNKTVDYDKTVTQLPAVTHEIVRPTEHHVTKEVITREIHHHDVYHRILPVIDLEILPTKHYVIDPERPGVLKEIPESEAPVTNNWTITPNINVAPTVNGTLAATEPTPHSLASICRRAHGEKDEPVLTGKRSYMTPEGFMRTEYFWRHPPTLDMTAFDRGETVPLRMNCMDENEFSDHLAQQSRLLGKTAENAVSSSNGAHGRGREVDGLQKRARAEIMDQHAVSPSPAAVRNVEIMDAARGSVDVPSTNGTRKAAQRTPKSGEATSAANGQTIKSSSSTSKPPSASVNTRHGRMGQLQRNWSARLHRAISGHD